MTQGELKGTAFQPASAKTVERQAPQPVSVYSAEIASGPDHLGRTAQAAFLAEVVAHRAAGTPLCIGIFGPAGSGKSSFQESLLANVEAIDHAATEAGLATPFHAGMTVVRVTAQAGVPAPRALMAAVGSGLARRHPRLLDEAAHAGLDTRSVARGAADELATARDRLDAERQALDALSGRQARLAETVLFETDGSGVDAYVRGNRGRIERRMRAFGVSTDPVRAFKTHIRDAHDSTAPLARGAGWLRAFYAYRGQGRLLVLTIVLLIAAWGVAMLGENQDKVAGLVQSGGDKLTGVADWLSSQWHWLVPTRRVLELCAFAALVINLARGIGFLQPINRGADLLRHELDSRRRELDTRLAQQTRRVDTLARDVDRLSRRAADAEGRLPPGDAAPVPAILAQGVAGGDGLAEAQAFFTALSNAIKANTAAPGRTERTPARLVVGLDGLETLSSPEAARFVDTTAGLLARSGIVLILAVDRMHLAVGFSETDPALASEKLRRLVQVPFDLGAGEDWSGAAAYARALLVEGDGAAIADRPAVDAGVSSLDRPWTGAEGAVLEAVAPLAGPTPRAVKQVVNLYRIARADPSMREATPKDLAALALGLALQASGLPSDLAGLPVEGDEADGVFEARRAIGAALGSPLGALDGQRGYEVARTYVMGPVAFRHATEATLQDPTL